MSTSLYDFSVRNYLQGVGAAIGFLARGAEHCEGGDPSPEDVVATCLYPDMASFHFQVVSVAHHSMGAIRGIQNGEFGPPRGYPDTDYVGLQELLVKTNDELGALDERDINALAGGRVVFRVGEREVPFTTENFILSFSLPNFYFHATTAYDILRSKGVPIGKRDFMGALRASTG